MTSSTLIETTGSITPPEGWTDEEARLHKTYYWADKPGTVRDVLEKRYDLSNAAPIWTCDPDEGEELFIFQASDPSDQSRYYLWNGLEDTVAQFVQEDLQNIKNEIISGQGSLKDVQFNDVE